MRCLTCGGLISVIDDCLCTGCRDLIVPVTDGCERCSGKLVDGRCGICRDRYWYPDRNIAVMEYAGPARDLLRGFKFGRRRRIYRPLGCLASEVIKRQGLEVDVVTSVPMNRYKTSRRGFNQSELVAKEVSRLTGFAYARLLAERPGRGTQKDLKYLDRFINILDRYVNRGTGVVNKRILLVDDVFTTGATINECARVLKENGAKQVWSLTIARRTLA